MSSKIYPSNTIKALLESDLITTPTREALQVRLNENDADDAPRFFDAQEFTTLRAACSRLIPQPDREHPIDVAVCIDKRLAEGTGNGWRYDSMPSDEEAYRRGLRGLDETAQAMFEAAFHQLGDAHRDEVLYTVKLGKPPGETWQTMPATCFFEELLAEVTEAYYSHPLAQEEIGYAGMADAHGWHAIRLNHLESWEPRRCEENQDEPDSQSNDVRSDHVAASSSSSTISSSPSIAPNSQPQPLQTRVFSSREPVDAVVIGTGAGGAPIMARLAQAGLSVVALEAGKQWSPARDFATDERSQSKLFWNDERLSAGDDPVAFGNNNSGTGVGGSTLHYTAYTPRVQPDDLRLYTEFGVGCDWPLQYSDLEPYYDELERFLGISGPSAYPWGPARRRAYPLAPLPLNGAAQLMQMGCATLGIRTSPAANAALSGSYYQAGVGWRAACTNRGFCQAGCTTGAKASMDVTFVPLALHHGAELLAESFVTSFETDDAGRITAVIYIHNGVEERQPCRAVFLCAGAIETPRLLLLNNLANSSGQVGCNFMAHTGVQLWGQFEEDVRPYKGIPGGLISEDTHRPEDADFAGGYLLQSIGVMPVTYASQAARGRGLWGEELKGHMHGYNHTAGINILGECLPYSHNRMELSDELDGRGLPKPRIFFTNGENERRLTVHAERLMREIWIEAGAQDIWVYPRNAHIIGTCRMGTDADSAVVNSEGRAFDVPNLYIADNSVFPSALSCNPALTIMALALRTADRFLEQSQ
ncbi:MAG: gluconate 2-dehydrogenase subunit 3 family protein [Pyrinomonadaceae bacterium]|nr:gluconate 2-dehydrogenase subunit 3 family protein [Pyrinomonadaceae bacterium]